MSVDLSKLKVGNVIVLRNKDSQSVGAVDSIPNGLFQYEVNGSLYTENGSYTGTKEKHKLDIMQILPGEFEEITPTTITLPEASPAIKKAADELVNGFFIRDKALAKAKAKYNAGVEERGGNSMETADGVGLVEWLKMMQEEAIDMIFYTEVMIQKLEGRRSE